MRWLSRARAAVWPEPVDPVERSLLRKADWLILPYLCLVFCFNYLDRVNFISAYVSGLREDLGMLSSEYNNVIACFTAGFAIAQIPQNLLLLVLPPRILFPLNGVIWGGLTMAGAGATKVEHLYVIKFFQGMAESSTFIGAHYVMGAWYKPTELGKRTAIFACSAQVASLFSGSLQGALYKNLNEVHGIKGWQWQFLVTGAATVPVALSGLFLFPDTPAKTRSRMFTPEERLLAVSRLGPRQATKLDRTILRRVFARWEVWLMSLIWVAGGALESYGAWGVMPVWMKFQRSAAGKPVYSVAQLNHYPMGLNAVAIGALLVTAVWTDHRTRDRFAVNLVVALGVLVSATLVLVGGLHPGTIPRGAYYVAFYLSGISFAGQMSNFVWANELLVHDEQARSLVLATMNVVSYAFNAWFQVVFFRTTSAPAFTQGSSLMIAFVGLMCAFTCAARYCQLRDRRRAVLGVDEGDQGAPSSTEADSYMKERGSLSTRRPGTATTDGVAGEDEEKEAPTLSQVGAVSYGS
ncbi:hypothetical protein JCM3775_000546 [Rhodotorula graminis]